MGWHALAGEVDEGDDKKASVFIMSVDAEQVTLDTLFSECTGLGSKSAIIERRAVTEGGQLSVAKLPGVVQWQDVICKRPITGDTSLWLWRELVENGEIDDARAKVTLRLVDRAAKAVLAEWELINAWPSAILGNSDLTNQYPGVESLTLTHEGIIRLK